MALIRSKLLLIAFLFFCFSSSAQTSSRLFLQAGLGLSGNTLAYKGTNLKPSIEFGVDKRIVGSIYVYAGINYYQTLHEVDTETAFSGTVYSEFDRSVIGLPILLRYSVGNRNLFYTDFGILPTYLLKANLRESGEAFDYNIFQFVNKEDEGDITEYLNRFNFSFRFAQTINYQRFQFVLSVDIPVASGRSSTGNLQENWALGTSSNFIANGGFINSAFIAFKFGYRLK